MKVPKRFCVWVIIILFFLGILALALWLDLRHQAPSFTIGSLSVPMSNDDLQNPVIFIALDVKNPNTAYSITYDYTALKVSYAQRTLGQTDKVISYQLKNSKASVSCQVEADVHQWETLVKAVSNSSREALLNVKLNTGIRYQNLGHTSKQYDLKFQGQLSIGSNGKISGKKKKVKLCNGSCKEATLKHHSKKIVKKHT